MQYRINKTRQKLKSLGLDACIFTNPTNIKYLSGFQSLERLDSILTITHTEVFLVVSSMYQEEVQDLPVVKDSSIRAIISKKGVKFIDLLAKWVPTESKIGFELDDIKLVEYKKWTHDAQFQLIETTGLIESLRMIKTDSEVNSIELACKTTKEVLSRIEKFLKDNINTQLSEIDVLEQIRQEMRGINSTEGFDSVVAFGANASRPHHNPTSIKQNISNIPILLDIGAKQNNLYSGDISRTYYLGDDPIIIEYIKIVKDCQKYIIDLVQPGVSFLKLHKSAVKFFQKYKLDKYFIHSIGHGLGLEVHEKPFISDSKELEPGNIITIEPGLYFPGQYGIRIEDVVLVTEQGHQVL